MTKQDQERMSLLYESTLLLPYDDQGTVRTGKGWFDRYMIFPWEKRGFKKVEGSAQEPKQ